MESEILGDTKDMNDRVYEKRRAVMDHLYEIRDFADIPRIDVRITENGRGEHEDVLGTGEMGGRTVYVADKAFTKSPEQFRSLVYHETLHAIGGVEHDPECPLMRESPEPLSAEQARKLFRAYWQNIKDEQS